MRTRFRSLSISCLKIKKSKKSMKSTNISNIIIIKALFVNIIIKLNKTYNKKN